VPESIETTAFTTKERVMSLTQKFISTTAIMLLSGVFANAQETPKPAKGKEQTLTGCLNKGADVAQHYMFTDQASGRKMTVTGPADLEKHSGNHTVRISGTMTNKVFNVTKLEHVAATCEAKGGAAK
jgi:hypothetical protein